MKDLPKKKLVPDTLDLVERAKLGLNGLMGTCDPELDFEPYFLTFYDVHPAYGIHCSSMVSGVQPKYLETLALLKAMTGTEKVSQEDGFLNAILENVKEDGLIYDRASEKRPWNVGLGYGKKSFNEDYACIATNGRLANGFYLYYQLTGDDLWKKNLKRTTERMLELAVIKDDYAYYPDSGCGNDFSYPKSGYPHKNEPIDPQYGNEGNTVFYQALQIRGFMKQYRVSGDERMLDISRRLARFCTKPNFYGGMVETDPVYGAFRGHWWGHFHGHLSAFRALMEYAVVAEDMRVKEFIRDAYEWVRHRYNPQLAMDSSYEGCTCGDHIGLAIQLTDAGLGDFWDDVDHMIRNALAEAQCYDLDEIKAVSAKGAYRPPNSKWGSPCDDRWENGIVEYMEGQECSDNMCERVHGAMSGWIVDGRYRMPMVVACCTANGLQGFYYAWEATVRHNDGVSTINLFFNRFTPWLDIESCLPYEGKVVITNKTSKKINIRIPAWVKRNDVRIKVNDNYVEPVCAGRYIVLSGLQKDEQITVEFPLLKRTLELTLPYIYNRLYGGGPKVTADFKGSTCIGLHDSGESINGEERIWSQMFKRPKFYSDKTIMKETDYFVVDKIIKWY